MFKFENEEQLEIRNSVQKLAREQIPSFQNDEFYGTVPRALFEKFAELGLSGLSVPEEFGGLGSGPLTTAIVMEEIAAVDMGCSIFLGVHCMVSGLISKFGNSEQKERYLPKLASGEMLGAFCLTEPSAGSDAASLKSTAIESGGSYEISGEKCYITSAGFADLYLVFARSTEEGGRDGISCFIVEKDTPGMTISPPEKKMGAALSPISSINFEKLNAASSNLLGELHQGYKVALGGLAGGRINIAACAIGISRTAIELALAHLKERKQFGQALIEFQGLQFMLADMKMKLEASQLLTWQAAHVLEQNPDSMENRLHPCTAKCFASDSAMSITTDAVQLLGGAGYIQDYHVERLMRDAKMLQIVEGANQVQRAVIVRQMLRAIF